MKKILTSAVAVISGMLTVANVCAAPAPFVEITIGTNKDTHTYTAQSTEETVSNSRYELDFRALGNGKTKEEKLKIRSVSKGREKVSVSFRLELEEADDTAQASALDYYDFVITDFNGEVVYSSADAPKSEPYALTKDIPLGVFNTQMTDDVKTYTMEYGINEETAAVVESVKAKKIDVKIVTTVSQEVPEVQTEAPAEQTEQPGGEQSTLKPKFELDSTEQPAASTATDNTTPTATASATPTATASASPEATEAPKEIKKECGKDISPGEYYVTGNGVVTVTDQSGKEKWTKKISDGKKSKIEAMKGFLVSLEKGDIITVVPLADMEKASIAFAPATTPKPTPTVKPASAATTTKGNSTTSASKGTSAKTTSSKASTASAKTNASASKTNPKTGDMGMALGMVGAFMGLSAVSFAGLEILKRKKK